MDEKYGGSAVKILATKIADQLVADGLHGKTLFVQTKKTFRSEDKLQKSHIFACMPDSISGKKCIQSRQRLVSRQESIGAPEFPWIPTFVNELAWKAAVQQCADVSNSVSVYSPYVFVKTFLVPALYPKGIPSDVEATLLKEWLIGRGVLEKAFFERRKSVFSFGPDSVLKEEPLSAVDRKPKFVTLKNQVLLDIDINGAMYRFKAGQTLDECVGIFLKVEKDNQRSTYSYIERLIQHIDKPIYERNPENTNRNTFDRIVVTVGLPVYMFETKNQLREAVKEYQQEITKRVIKRIQEDATFKKFGVPIGVLRCSNIFFRQDNTLDYIFELKLLSEEDC